MSLSQERKNRLNNLVPFPLNSEVMEAIDELEEEILYLKTELSKLDPDVGEES